MKPTLPLPHKREKGQILVIMALIFIGLVAVIGLAIDVGYMYVSYSRLSRGVDAAALSAASQFKKNATTTKLDKAAREFLVLNGIPDDTLSAQVDTCATASGDPALCKDPPRKIVRVTAREDVPLFFMSIFGIQSVPISVTSLSEAAAVDLVLVIDRSDSMGFLKDDLTDYGPFAPGKAPKNCNAGTFTDSHGTWTGTCHPFHEVKEAAWTFIEEFMDPAYDRIAIVAFDIKSHRINFDTGGGELYLLGAGQGFSDPKAMLQDTIKGLYLYDGFVNTGGGQDNRPVSVPAGSYDTYKAPKCPFNEEDDDSYKLTLDWVRCQLFNSGESSYYRIDCVGGYLSPIDFSRCGSTNIGAALNDAAYILSHWGREESLWVTIMLTDGVPNVGLDSAGNPICPEGTKTTLSPLCIDKYPLSRHAKTDLANYDVMDYSMDKADDLATGVHSTVFAIGLGNELINPNYTDPIGPPYQGETLLNYIADAGGTDTYYPATPQSLRKVFLTIANKIGTRLTK